MNGSRWKIGNSTNIKVIGESWLREEDGIWLQTPQVQGAYAITVNNLLLPNGKMWDKEKIESIFSLDIATCILYVPLFEVVEKDQLVWSNDDYDYSLLMKLTGRGGGLTASKD
jgi:hypothetical protein